MSASHRPEPHSSRENGIFLFLTLAVEWSHKAWVVASRTSKDRSCCQVVLQYFPGICLHKRISSSVGRERQGENQKERFFSSLFFLRVQKHSSFVVLGSPQKMQTQADVHKKTQMLTAFLWTSSAPSSDKLIISVMCMVCYRLKKMGSLSPVSLLDCQLCFAIS